MRRLLPLVLLIAAGCDRVELDPIGTALLVSDPDLSVVQLEPDLTVRLVPPSLDGRVTLQIAGEDVPFDSTARAFVFETRLAEGLNAFPFTVTDDAGTVEPDTLFAVYLPAQVVPLSSGSQGIARADAAVTTFDDGRALVSGGSDASGQALRSAEFLRSSGGAIVQTDEVPLQRARTGHTSTMFEGGALLLGGTTTADPRDASDFVPGAELVLPDGTTRQFGLESGIARTAHTTFLIRFGGVTYLYLYGGRVPSGSAIVESGTVDVFEVVEGEGPVQLERLSPPGGSGAFEPVSDHVQIRTSRASAVQLGLGGGGPVASRFVWTTPGTALFPFSLLADEVTPTHTPRVGAALVQLEDGLSLVIGGRDRDGETLSSLEVYSPVANRSFTFPSSVTSPSPVELVVPRSDAIATMLGTDRIVISGGRSRTGTTLVAYESIQL